MSSGMSVRVSCKLSNRHPTIKFTAEISDTIYRGREQDGKGREAGDKGTDYSPGDFSSSRSPPVVFPDVRFLLAAGFPWVSVFDIPRLGIQKKKFQTSCCNP